MFWTKSHPKDGVYSVFWWSYLVARCFGLMPFSIEYDVQHKLSKVYLTVFDCLWFVIAITIYVLLIVYSILDYKFDELSNTDKIARLVVYCGGSITVIVSIVMDMINRKRIWKIVTLLNEFDVEVNKKYFCKMPIRIYLKGYLKLSETIVICIIFR